MRYSHIVFDIDGTLLDTEYAVLHSLQDTLLTLSKKRFSLSELSFSLGITGADALKKLDIQDIPKAIELWNKNMCRYTNTVTIFNGITVLLEELLRLNYKIGIVTSKTREEFEYDFCKCGIAPYFETIVCADDTKEHKPNAAPLLKYLEVSKAEREKILYVGDSEYDSQCAENSGIDFALATWGSQSNTIKAKYFPVMPEDLLSIIQ